MKYDEMISKDRLILSEDKVYEHEDASDLDRKMYRIHRVVILREVVEPIIDDVLADDVLFAGPDAKYNEIVSRLPVLKQFARVEGRIDSQLQETHPAIIAHSLHKG